MEAVLRILALSIFRCSLAASQKQSRREMKAVALLMAVAVVATFVIYPLTVVLSERRCRYVRRLFFQFFVSDLVRGLPLALAISSAWYVLLTACGARDRVLQDEVQLTALDSWKLLPAFSEEGDLSIR
ncbi:unnamed protein product [Symbiodinium sp. CCMP2592]|nr:unnamed protein product [Symbiodinium sp. CCMP2592]